jgi:aryl-alcohol dehydrogenase-like predicted oxidoreductase
MGTFNRRDFLRTSIAGAGIAAIAPRVLRADAPAAQINAAGKVTSISGGDIVELGKTGIKVSRLAQGTGYNGTNHSSEQTRAGKALFDKLLHHGLDNGISFLDMADLYGSHPFVKDVIKGIKRDKLTMLSKIWPRKDKWVTPPPSGGAKAEVDRFCKELDTDYLDVCLIHCMMDKKWAVQYERIRDELSDLKQKGAVRAVGVSCHDLGALKVAAEHPWVDVIFARVNNKCGKDYFCDGTVEEVTSTLRTARKNGKSVVGMKIFGAGKLVKPEEKDASLQFVLGAGDLVDAITIGMTDSKQVDDTLARIAKVKVS